MKPNWNEHFEFYMSHMGEESLSVLVDLGVQPHVPVETHNVRIRAMVQMKHPRGDGQRSSVESQALLETENRLIRGFDERFDATLVGSVTVRGVCDLVFYAPGTTLGQLEALREAADEARGDYEVELDLCPDVTWEFYREVLWPNHYEHQFILTNRRLLELAERGEDVTASRQIEHRLWLPTAEAADQTTRELGDKGFTTASRNVEGETSRLVLCERVSLDPQVVHGRVAAILDVVLPLEGDYDGWTLTGERG